MKTITQQILASLLLTVLVVFGGAGYLELQKTVQTGQEDIQRDVSNIIGRLSFSLVYPLWNLNQAEVEKTIYNEAVEESVSAIVLYDDIGQLYAGFVREGTGKGIDIYDSGNPLHRQVLENKHDSTSVDIFKNGTMIGKVVVYANVERLQSIIREQEFKLAVKLLGLLAALACVQFLILRKVVIQPLTQLRDWVTSIGPGKIFPPPQQIHCEEIAALTSSFSGMTEKLTSNLAEIADRNAELQDRESELRDKNEKLTVTKEVLRKQLHDLQQSQLALSDEMDERRRAEAELQRSETKFQTLYESSSDALWLLDERGFQDCNKAAIEIFGAASKEDLRSKHPSDLSPPIQACGTDSKLLANQLIARAFEMGSLHFEWMHKRVDTGQAFPAEVVLTAMELDGKPILQATVRDITERKQAEKEIQQLAYFDPLTQLPNRRLLMDRLDQALITSNRTQEFGALMILDLDNFKTLNDTQGHHVGDCLLIEVARRISATVRQEDTVSRLGGDEFVVMMENLGSNEITAARQAEAVAETISGVLNQPYMLSPEDPAHHSTPSIGLSLFRGHETDIEVFLKQAEMALYQAKATGRNTIRFFNPAMQAIIEARSALETALRNGLEREEFRLFYQPQVDQDGHLIGAEALLRWFPAHQAPFSPAQFIPLAEETGLIVPIGRWVMQTACNQLRQWAQNPKTRDLQIAINVSARQFRQPDFVKQVRDNLERSGVRPALLKLELTESVVLDNIEEAIDRMQQLKALGIAFSLDDFGTGFSSLSYLKRLPLDQVKIDQSFIHDVTTDKNDAAIVRGIIAISHALGLEVIAEGVETKAQLDFLRDSDCLNYQGFLFGKPAPITEWGSFLAA